MLCPHGLISDLLIRLLLILQNQKLKSPSIFQGIEIDNRPEQPDGHRTRPCTDWTWSVNAENGAKDACPPPYLMLLGNALSARSLPFGLAGCLGLLLPLIPVF
jgi:hypothetical protein